MAAVPKLPAQRASPCIPAAPEGRHCHLLPAARQDTPACLCHRRVPPADTAAGTLRSTGIVGHVPCQQPGFHSHGMTEWCGMKGTLSACSGPTTLQPTSRGIFSWVRLLRALKLTLDVSRHGASPPFLGTCANISLPSRVLPPSCSELLCHNHALGSALFPHGNTHTALGSPSGSTKMVFFNSQPRREMFTYFKLESTYVLFLQLEIGDASKVRRVVIICSSEVQPSEEELGSQLYLPHVFKLVF